jgi:hypothetical protein
MVYPAYTCGTNRLNAAYPTNSFILRAVRVKTGYTLTKISHNISYMKISYMKSLYGIETNFIYEIFRIWNISYMKFSYMKLFQFHIKISYMKYFIYEIFIYEIVSIPHKDFIYQIFHIW